MIKGSSNLQSDFPFLLKNSTSPFILKVTCSFTRFGAISFSVAHIKNQPPSLKLLINHTFVFFHLQYFTVDKTLIGPHSWPVCATLTHRERFSPSLRLLGSWPEDSVFLPAPQDAVSVAHEPRTGRQLTGTALRGSADPTHKASFITRRRWWQN